MFPKKKKITVKWKKNKIKYFITKSFINMWSEQKCNKNGDVNNDN